MNESTRAAHRNQWKAHIEAWEGSGLTQKAYCEREQLNRDQFGYYRQQFKRHDSPPKLTPLTIKPNTASNGVRITVFDYRPHRKGDAAMAMLDGFTDYVQTDMYSGYGLLEQQSGITRLGCLAHARRKFIEAEKVGAKHGLASEAIAQLAELYRIEDALKDVDVEAHHHARLVQSQPRLIALKQWLDEHVASVLPKSKLGEAFSYSLKHWHYLTHYLEDGRLAIDNNGVENAIRPFAIGRKNWRVPLARNQLKRQEVTEAEAA